MIDTEKDNVNDKEVEYITVDGKEKYTVNDIFPVDTDIIVYYSYIEESLPILSSKAKGKAYDEVAGLFDDSKFEVEYKLIGDADGDNVHENEIEYIEIASTSDYTLEDKYPINNKIVIYHSFIEDKMPITSSNAKGMNYKEVLKMFEGTKFNNVKTKNGCKHNIDASETTVEKITINGSESYSVDKGYPYNSEICIYYSLKKYNVSLQLECSENWIFDKYDVLVYVDGNKVGTLKHGKTKTFKVQLSKGKYDLILKSVEDSSVQGTKTFNIKADRLLRYAVNCYGSNVKLTYYKQLKVPYTNEDAIGENIDEVVKAFEDAEYDVTKKALNDLSANDLGKSNTVSKIKIDNNSNFTKDSIFYKGTDVVVYYHSGIQIETPMSSSDTKGTDYKDVVTKFKNAGFLNVTSKKYTGKYNSKARNSAVAEIQIDGDDYFSSGEKCSLDAKIVVYYYEISYKSVTVQKMMNDLENNSYNANTYYKNRYVSATGWVSDIDSSGTKFELVSTSSSWDFYGITCEITESSQKDIIAKLSTGKKVTVTGKITLVSDYGYYMDIHSITIK